MYLEMPKYPTELVIQMESKEGLEFNLVYTGLMLSFIPATNQGLYLHYDEALVFRPSLIKISIALFPDVSEREPGEAEQAKMERVRCVMFNGYLTDEDLIEDAAKWRKHTSGGCSDWRIDSPNRVRNSALSQRIDGEIKRQKEEEKEKRRKAQK